MTKQNKYGPPVRKTGAEMGGLMGEFQENLAGAIYLTILDTPSCVPEPLLAVAQEIEKALGSHERAPLRKAISEFKEMLGTYEAKLPTVTARWTADAEIPPF